MFLNALKAEQIKLHKCPIWIAFFIIPCISAILGTVNYVGNIDVLGNEWYSLWTQHTLFFCYFCFPALIGMYCSYICRLEHMNNNWNSVLTAPVSFSSIYFSKFITIMKMLFLTQVFVGVLFYISGKIVGLTSPVPSGMFSWLFFGFCASCAIAAAQLALSLIIRSFAVPIGISLLGGIMGIAVRSKGLGLYYPYSLFPIGMCSNNPEGNLEFSVISFMISCILFVIIFSGISILKIKKR